MTETGMVAVYMRTDYENNGQFFTFWSMTQLDELIRTVVKWGIFDGEDTKSDAVGQFRLDPRPHFEVVVVE